MIFVWFVVFLETLEVHLGEWDKIWGESPKYQLIFKTRHLLPNFMFFFSSPGHSVLKGMGI